MISPSSSSASQNSDSPSSFKQEALPSYIRWLLSFQVFNAFNFTIALGAPSVLFARYLGAGESIIGVLLSLTPFLACLQIFSTELADRWGYRRMMITGWSLRAFMLLPIVALPLLVGKVSTGILITLLFLSLFAFNAIRGVASCAWFPWLRELVPTEQRGYFLGLEQRVISASVLITMLLCGWFLGDQPQGWRYSVLFAAAWAGGLLSVAFLFRVPNKVPNKTPSTINKPQHRDFRQRFEAAKRIWTNKPFRRVTRFAAFLALGNSSLFGFLVLYLKDEFHWSDGKILLVGSGTTVGVLLTAVLWGRLSDRTGSRPILRLIFLGQFLFLIFWILCSFGVLQVNIYLVGIAYVLFGISIAAQAIAQTRLTLACCPDEDPTLAMMVNQVILALSWGGAPLFWGFALKAMRLKWNDPSGSINIPFAVFFLTSLAILIVAQGLLSKIQEPRAMTTRRLVVQMLWGWPLRILSGFAPQTDRNRK